MTRLKDFGGQPRECRLDHLACGSRSPRRRGAERFYASGSSIFLKCGHSSPGRSGSSTLPSMRIGIANDTGLAREALRRVVLSSPANEVAWMAKDGAEAVALAREDAPI